MARSDLVEAEGIVTDILPGSFFKIDLGNGHSAICTLSGKLRTNFIRISVGDSVKIAVSPADPTRGIIRWRNK